MWFIVHNSVAFIRKQEELFLHFKIFVRIINNLIKPKRYKSIYELLDVNM